jgi:hypothetical protein
MSAESNLQNASKWEVECDTELIPTEQGDRSTSKVQSVLTLIKTLCQNAISLMAAEPQLRIWQQQDRYGRIHWYVCDPLTYKSISFASELEMLRWLEDLHSRSRW